MITTWTSKPPLGTPLDPRHPSVAGLQDYFPMWEGGGSSIFSIGPRAGSYALNASGNNTFASAPVGRPDAGLGLTGTGTTSVLTTTDNYYNSTWLSTQPFSVAFFYSPVGSLNVVPWSNLDSTQDYRGFEVAVDAAGKVNLYVNIQFTAPNALQQLSSFVMSLGNTYHVLVTYDGTKVAGSVKMYINGVQDTLPAPATATLGAGTTVSAVKFQIGSRPGGTSGLSKRVSDLAIWDRAMPSAEAIAYQANPWAIFQPSISMAMYSAYYGSPAVNPPIGGGPTTLARRAGLIAMARRRRRR